MLNRRQLAATGLALAAGAPCVRAQSPDRTIRIIVAQANIKLQS